MDNFLPDFEGLGWDLPEGCGDSAVLPDLLYLQDAQLGLQVAVGDAPSKPKAEDIRKVWRRREDGKGFPLMLVVRYPKAGVTTCAVCGPTGEQPKLDFDLDPQAVARVCNIALKRPNRASALSFLATAEVEEQSGLPGLRNVGLFATHELANGVPARGDWSDACTDGRPVLGTSGRELVTALGFKVADRGLDTSVLVAADEDQAVAVFLEETEAFNQPAGRFVGVSPVAHALAAADREGLAWVMMVRGSTVRLYPAKPDVGVGRRGRAGTYVEANLDLLPFERAGYLTLLFSAEALAGESVAEILESSSIYVAGLGGRLRDRVYFDAVPSLATAIAGAFDDTSAEGLRASYQRTMTVLFRLLFVAYGEDKELLPYRTNGAYADRSLTNLAKELTERLRAEQPFDPHVADLWNQVVELWAAIEKGRNDWDVPAYGGTLFSTHPAVNPDGAAIAGIALTDAQFGPMLTALLVDVGPDGLLGPVDFRSLSVREFGTIYEGLLESELSVARSDLAEVKGNLVPAGEGDEVVVAEGEIYFHNRSGERKSTGSYFTKPFAVEHLLKTALTPAINGHLDEVSALLADGDEAGAAKRLFEFRCADLAMGSGHFLVAAVDHLEAAFSKFLVENPIGPINAELVALRTAAIKQLSDIADRYRIDNTQILRRLIARRCVFGCDLNPIAVELARLSIWIHTFVAGLPLGFLDHNLRVGNSLTGIGTIDEINEFLGEDNFLAHQIADQLSEASRQLQRLATVNDARITDVEAAHQAIDEASEALSPLRRLLDLIVLKRAGFIDIEPLALADPAVVDTRHSTDDVQKFLTELQPTHFALEFPEIFSGPSSGFDSILGNPPWEKVKIERHRWWAARTPSVPMRGPVAEINSAIKRASIDHPDLETRYATDVLTTKHLSQILGKTYRGKKAGDPDLYQMFCWRSWSLTGTDGHIGLVLPRGCLSDAGMAPWRLEIFEHGSFVEVTTGTNVGGWMFDDAHQRQQIGLVTIRKRKSADELIRLRGPYYSLHEYRESMKAPPLEVPMKVLRESNEGASFPSIPGPAAWKVFARFNDHPRIGDQLGDLQIKPLAELHATADKALMYFPEGGPANKANQPGPNWVPVYKGESFDLWEPDRGIYYAWANRETIDAHLANKRVNQAKMKKSAYFGLSPEEAADQSTLGYKSPRIAFRNASKDTNSRTFLCALLPPSTSAYHGSPVLVRQQGSERDEAYLLGVMSSTVFDWQSRRIVEVNVTFDVFGRFRVPDPSNGPGLVERIVEIAGRLAAVDDQYVSWAEAVGVPVGSVTAQAEKNDLIAELDAVVAHLYGLDAEDLKVIWDTFHTTVDHLPPLDKVLGYCETWAR